MPCDVSVQSGEGAWSAMVTWSFMGGPFSRFKVEGDYGRIVSGNKFTTFFSPIGDAGLYKAFTITAYAAGEVEIPCITPVWGTPDRVMKPEGIEEPEPSGRPEKLKPAPQTIPNPPDAGDPNRDGGDGPLGFGPSADGPWTPIPIPGSPNFPTPDGAPDGGDPGSGGSGDGDGDPIQFQGPSQDPGDPDPYYIRVCNAAGCTVTGPFEWPLNDGPGIEGSMVDPSGQPLPGPPSIQFVPVGGGTPITVPVNEDGTFDSGPLDAGDWDVFPIMDPEPDFIPLGAPDGEGGGATDDDPAPIGGTSDDPTGGDGTGGEGNGDPIGGSEDNPVPLSPFSRDEPSGPAGAGGPGGPIGVGAMGVHPGGHTEATAIPITPQREDDEFQSMTKLSCCESREDVASIVGKGWGGDRWGILGGDKYYVYKGDRLVKAC